MSSGIALVNLYGALVYTTVVSLFFRVGSDGRLGGLIFYDANDFALVMVCTIPFAIYFLGKGQRRSRRIAALITMAMIFTAMVKSGSRGGFIGLIAVMLYVLLRYRAIPSRVRLAVTVAGVVLFFGFASDKYWTSMGTILHPQNDYNYSDNVGRVEVWKRGVGYMIHNPIVGVGVTAYSVAEGGSDLARSLAAEGKGFKWSVAHNSFLETGAELGIPGALVFIGILVVTAYGLTRISPRGKWATWVSHREWHWRRCSSEHVRLCRVRILRVRRIFRVPVLPARSRRRIAEGDSTARGRVPDRAAAVQRAPRESDAASEGTRPRVGAQLHRNVARRRTSKALTIASSAHDMDFRRHIKSTIEHGALWSGIPLAMRRQHRGDVLVLAYHNIVPEGAEPAGDRSLHLPQRRFAEQLDALARTHDIIPLASALAGHSGERPAVVLTFDDAYEGAVTVGVAELTQRGLPATIFVAPSFVNGHDFWWDALTAPDARALSPALRAWALDECAGRDAEIRARAPREHRASLVRAPSHARGAQEHDLVAAAARPGITLGSHSWNHPNLARLDDAALATEMTLPLDWLRERFTNVLPVISYPYGLSSARVEIAARAAGYTAGLRIDGGWLSEGSAENPYAVPRLDVPSGISAAGFELRTAGVRVR